MEERIHLHSIPPSQAKAKQFQPVFAFTQTTLAEIAIWAKSGEAETKARTNQVRIATPFRLKRLQVFALSLQVFSACHSRGQKASSLAVLAILFGF